MESRIIDNVTRIHQSRVFNHIQTFLINKGKRSKHTQRAYERDIRQFVSFMYEKDMEDLMADELRVMYSDVLEYQNFLIDKYNGVSNTVNRKIEAIRSLYKFLKANEYDVNLEAFKVDKVSNNSKKIGVLSPTEAWAFANCALETERENAELKHALILTAASTSLRMSELLRITYDDIRKDHKQDDMYIIEVIQKGGETRIVEIHSYLYNIFEKYKNKSENNKVFNFYQANIHHMMERLCERLSIDPKRHISFHSFKKAGVDMAYMLSNGDAAKVMSQGGWTNMNTFYNNYYKGSRNISGRAFFETISDDIFSEMSKEELLKLILKQNEDVKLKLKHDAKKMIHVEEEMRV